MQAERLAAGMLNTWRVKLLRSAMASVAVHLVLLVVFLSTIEGLKAWVEVHDYGYELPLLTQLLVVSQTFLASLPWWMFGAAFVLVLLLDGGIHYFLGRYSRSRWRSGIWSMGIIACELILILMAFVSYFTLYCYMPVWSLTPV
ncbi:hypothetical protein ACFL34_04635 [Candidatus Sumerlaeota bacterium]